MKPRKGTGIGGTGWLALLLLAGCGSSGSSGGAGGGETGAPTAGFGASGTSGAVPLRVVFSDQSTGTVTGWEWDFGDGSRSGQADPAHLYTAPGTYSVTLTVTGPGGSDSLTRTDLVQASAGGGPTGPTALFGATGNTGDAPLTVAFSDQSTGTITDWAWTFGDGASSSQSDPAHTYTAPGTYTVTLTVTGPDGSDSLMRTDYVRAFDPNRQGIWTSSREVAALAMSGSAWNSLLSEANRATGTPDVSNQDDDTDVRVLAKALVFARTGDDGYRQDVIDACMAAIDTELGGRTLALGRNLIGYVLAADLVGLPATEDTQFRAWLRRCRTESLSGMTLISTHEDRPNNWGTHAGASRAAVALYLDDQTDLARCAQVFRGWLGDRGAYAGFSYGDLAWQADSAHPVGINPRGATRSGHSIDGVLPDDQRRAGGFIWPPPKENYVWEALQGALAQAVILSRAGYDVWSWSDQALLRAATWLHDQCNYPASGDDTWEPHVLNYFYAADFPAPVPTNPGKNVGWTDWTLQ